MANPPTPRLPPVISTLVQTLVEKAEEVAAAPRICTMMLALIEKRSDIEVWPSGQVHLHYTGYQVEMRIIPPPSHHKVGK